jgi:serine protease Do
MNAGFELDESIESYLKGSMTEEEKLDFEERIASNYALKERVLEHMELVSAMGTYARRQNISRKLSEIHHELFPPAVEETAKPVVIRKLYNPYRTFAIAASFALLLLSGTITALYFRYVHNSGRAEFRELRRDVEKIRNSQTAIIKDIKSGDHQRDVIPANFMGTGFAISANGYVITSSHVIRDADSVFIEGTKGRYKAKVIFIDKYYDYAILKVEDSTFRSFGNLPYALRKNESELGEKIYTLGYPREEIVFGEGSLSSVTGYMGDSSSYQVSIPVNPGNSGGPVLDEKGNLIGMISGKQSTSDGAAFAIKSSLLMRSISEIPADSLKTPINLPKLNLMASQDRVKQLKRLKDYIFIVKVYN